ncbi:zinc finger protein 239-like isoform X2 [Maniola jurtina]|uniref:zinc finger protein 239-like isoform X2 n=1 Tax=Maniola jurtina TaxID=191418 RepID=UPI001E688E96|nr:zinc finger protein 239-like isoform X2 [Maniola jurtina]
MEDQITASICELNYLIEPKKEILDDREITHECGDKDLVPKKEITNTNLNLDTTVLNQHIDIPIKIEIEQNTCKMEQQAPALCDANYLIEPKKEILDDRDVTHECGDKDLVPKKEITNTNLHLDTTVLNQHIDIPIKIELEQNTWKMEQQAIALCDANYLIEPKKEILDDRDVTHECGDKGLVPKKEITNTSLHLDTTVLNQHIDIPIKIEIEQNTWEMELQAIALSDANYLIEPKKEILDDLECGDKDLVPKKEITNTNLNLDADLDQPMTNIVIPIKTETILSEGIVGLQKAYKSEDAEMRFCDTDLPTVHMKTQYVQEPFQSEVSVNLSQPVTSSNSTNPHNTGNLEYENVNTSVNHTRTKEKTNFCDHCPYKCVKPSHLKTHMMSHTGEKPYHCNQCNYKSSKSSAIKYHMRTHTGEKPYQCNQCDCKFSMSSALKNHIRTHTGEKPYQCKHCDYKTSTAGALKYHMRTHTGEKPYSCEHCEYKCTNSSHLKAHMRTHTGEKPYRCKQCDYKCSKSSYLKAHMTIHTGYCCLQCDYTTMAISAFKYHIKNHT